MEEVIEEILRGFGLYDRLTELLPDGELLFLFKNDFNQLLARLIEEKGLQKGSSTTSE